MTRDELEKAFRALGERCDNLECVVVGSAAAILSGWLNRGTLDVDVVYSVPKLSAIEKEISGIAEDIEDLQDLAPTEEEIEFVVSQLERIARFDAPSAYKMELYLDQK